MRKRHEGVKSALVGYVAFYSEREKLTGDRYAKFGKQINLETTP